MIYNEEKALERVNSEDNLINKLQRIKSGNLEVRKLPRSEGPKQIPPMVQELIGVAAALSSGAEASRVFGAVTPQMANLYKNGETNSTRGRVAEHIETIHTKAIDAMLASIDKVTELVPNVRKATDASIIASNMAKVIEKTTAKQEDTKNRVVIVAYAPNMKLESDFDTIEVHASQG